MRVARQIAKEMTTKKTKAKSAEQEMRSEYRFDYSKARPNRFAARMSEDTVAVVLDPDVASAFRTSTAVNRALRRAMKAQRGPKKKAG